MSTVVSLDDLPLVEGYSWCAVRTKDGPWYAQARVGRRMVSMHRLLLGFPLSDVDHKDGDGLNNQRDNLRTASSVQNGANQGIRSTNTSGYKGVYKGRGSRWFAYVGCNGRLVWAGSHVSKEEAAEAYNAKALELHGEFARLNDVRR